MSLIELTYESLIYEIYESLIKLTSITSIGPTYNHHPYINKLGPFHKMFLSYSC